MPQKCVLEINLSLGRPTEEELHFSWAMASIFQTCGIQMPVRKEHSPSWGRHTHTHLIKTDLQVKTSPAWNADPSPWMLQSMRCSPDVPGAIKCTLAGTGTSWFPGSSPVCSLWGTAWLLPGWGGTACGNSSLPQFQLPGQSWALHPQLPGMETLLTRPRLSLNTEKVGTLIGDPSVNSPLN